MGDRRDHHGHQLSGRKAIFGVDAIDEHVGEMGDGGGVLEIVERIFAVAGTNIYEVIGEMTWETCQVRKRRGWIRVRVVKVILL